MLKEIFFRLLRDFLIALCSVLLVLAFIVTALGLYIALSDLHTVLSVALALCGAFVMIFPLFGAVHEFIMWVYIRRIEKGFSNESL